MRAAEMLCAMIRCPNILSRMQVGGRSAKCSFDLETTPFAWCAGNDGRTFAPCPLKPLVRGLLYTRPELTKLWGYDGYQAFSKGVFTPRGSRTIVLFVTRRKQQSLTAYVDHLDGDLLHWEGEKGHGNDFRIARSAENGEEIHLFYRDVHHTPFRYYGQILLTRYIERQDRPSKFEFELLHNMSVADDLDVHQRDLADLPVTERLQITKARVGQGRFREHLVQLWKGCAVSGVERADLVRASHIKPWRLSSNEERLDPSNGLLLLPQYDHLFDGGYISFDDDGRMMQSPVIEDVSLAVLGVGTDPKLRRITDEHREYLAFHRSHLFVRRSA
jgi:putative restriction endonuclease